MAEKFGFLIVPDFAFYGLFPSIEALRVANHNSGRKLYEWCLISIDGAPVTATNRMSVAVDHSIQDCPKLSVCFAVAGNHPLDHCSGKLLNWLRQIDRYGTTLGAFDSGVFLLSAAGLLDGQTAAVHWEIAPTVREHYPKVNITDRIYRIDKRRLTCAGGSSTIDLMLTLIANAHGQALAEGVSNGLVHRPHRAGSERQLPERPNEITREHALLRKVTSYMENRIEDPEKIDKISNMFGLTQRKLENLFSQHLNVLPSAYYLNLRLTHAREYLFYSGMSVKEIALACGFSSAAVFCRAFRRFHRLSPRQYRRQVSAETLKQFSNSYDPGAGPQILSAWHDLHSAAPSLGDRQRRRITPPLRADRR